MRARGRPYERTRRIEQRISKARELITGSPMNTRKLATALNVSRPTAQRIVSELKRRGYKIRSVRDDHGWHYELAENSAKGNRETNA
jgi:Mn-dependent DtxR family transcriptional regulator